MIPIEVSNTDIERKELPAGGTQGTCVVWIKGFMFCHLVTGVVGLKVG